MAAGAAGNVPVPAAARVKCAEPVTVVPLVESVPAPCVPTNAAAYVEGRLNFQIVLSSFTTKSSFPEFREMGKAANAKRSTS